MNTGFPQLGSAHLLHISRLQDIERASYSDEAGTGHRRGIVQLPAVVYQEPPNERWDKKNS